MLYFASGYSVIQALNAITGELLWRYDPHATEVAGERMRGAWGVRGIAYWEGKIFTGTVDGRLIAIDARTGRELWSVMTVEPKATGATFPARRWVFNGNVVIGHGGGDFAPVRGYVTAYDADTGAQKLALPHRARQSRGRLRERRHAHGGGNLGRRMVALSAAAARSGTPWPTTRVTTGSTSAPATARRGTRKSAAPAAATICSSARSSRSMPTRGEYVWHYQVNPGETWDYNAAMDIELADLEIEGRTRHVILHAPKNGFFYVIDREDGTLISAEPFAQNITWAERIDPRDRAAG